MRHRDVTQVGGNGRQSPGSDALTMIEAANTTADRAAVPELLAGRYRLEREIGRGGMAVVYAARDIKHDRQVAVKILSAGVSAALGRERFLTEIDVASRLNHQNIVSLYDSGEADGLLFYVMPLVEGESLRARLAREGPLPIDETLRLGLQLCDALTHAHTRRIVHRDIKPENILIEGERILVCDFGIARAVEAAGGASLTATGVIIGTPAYMSPEQASGAAVIDHRSDIYSLGCVLFEMLAGQPPFTGSTPQQFIAQHVAAPVPSLALLRPGVSLGIERVVERALAKVPTDRFATAQALADALTRQQTSPTASRELITMVRRLVRSHRVGAAIVSAAVLVAIGWPWIRGQPRGASATDGALRLAAPGQSRSQAALVAFTAGSDALQQWNLALADSAFQAATDHDPEFAQAYLWLARVRYWNAESTLRWRFAAERAAAQRKALSPSDQVASDALLAQARGEADRACATWSALTRRDPFDFSSWFSLGTCLRFDNAVIRDPASPSGWSFRGSYNAALNAYERAFQLRPSIHRSFRGGLFEDVRRLLKTNRTDVRAGRALPSDTTTFAAIPSWQGDSLALIPWPEEQFWKLDARTRATNGDIAIKHQRQRFYNIAVSWRAAFPRAGDSDAAEALAVALDLLGNSTALDTVRAARLAATDDRTRLRLGALEVWMRVKYAAGKNSESLAEAARLAAQLLRDLTPHDANEARQLASLAALTGRATLAAKYNRLAADESPAIMQSAPALLAFAALGGPPDSLRQLEAELLRGLDAGLVAAQRAQAEALWVVRSAALAMPTYRFERLSSASGGGYLGDIVRAWRASDTTRLRQVIEAIGTARQQRGVRPWEVTIDVVYPEAAAQASLGDRRAALDRLAAALDSLSLVSPELLADVARAGALVRAMVLRADLDKALGDTVDAGRWANTVAILRADADEDFQPLTHRMQQLAPPRSLWSRLSRSLRLAL